MNQVRFSELALQDLEDIAEYITQDSATLARRVIGTLGGFCYLLGVMPELGRRSEIAGVRRLVTPRYRYKIAYQIDSRKKEVVILRVYHGTRNMPY